MENKSINNILFLIVPQEHGNGGWCGYEVLDVITKEWALQIDPVIHYFDGHYNPAFGSQIRLCNSKNPNDVECLFNHEDSVWEDSFGTTICKPISNHRLKETVTTFAMISEHPYYPTIELFDSQEEAANAATQEINRMEDETGRIEDSYVAVAKILWKKNIRTNY